MNDSAIAAEALSRPILLAANGTLRRVGGEIEFLGPSARVAAEALARDLGGSCEAEDPHAFRIRSTRFSEMMIETDLRHVQPRTVPGARPETGSPRGGMARHGGVTLCPAGTHYRTHAARSASGDEHGDRKPAGCGCIRPRGRAVGLFGAPLQHRSAAS
ncbi:hypothetical protein DC522_15730 [Microvirga sp. KLBC 81]|nr:hypothetical protein DC522_15730 [Microvirga sp. KLBC 81]